VTPFALGHFVDDDDRFTGIVAGGTVARVADLLAGWADAGIDGLFGEWDAHIAALREHVDTLPHRTDVPTWPEAALRRLAPLAPRQLFGAGMNYRTHVVDLMVDSGLNTREEAMAMMDERAQSGVPLVWAGLTSSICGPDDEVQLRDDVEQNDWELELAVVIGKAARGVSKAEALDYVAGYSIVNDITARDLVGRNDAGPVSVDWLRSKCSPTYKPIGPYVVPAAFVPDAQDLVIELRLNGEVMQHESTADMIFDVATLVSFLSHEVQLLPGDVLMTGSPAGNGTHHGRFLRDGDIIEGEIAGFGVQRTACVVARS
jgi:2,4-diketo-3-deoxy-L-fuconate hydrolase